MTEAYKPFLLSAQYLENLQPSSLSKPFSLTAVYDENATWGTDYIVAQGFDAQSFGEHLVTYNQNINVIGYATLDFGQATLFNLNQFTHVLGIQGTQFGTQSIYNLTKNISLNNRGFLTQAFGTANIWNFNKEIKVTGFNTQVFGTQSKVYNLRQYLNLNSRGINSALYGTAYLQGGVKYVTPTGFNSSALINPKVVNTKADQYVSLSGKAIQPIALTSPDISPKFLRPAGINLERYGSPTVYLKTRFLYLSGFNTQSFGVQWASHSPRHITPTQVEAYLSGYAKIFDPTQKVYLADRGLDGGIFGDIAVRNTRRIISVDGLYAQSFSDWGVVESNLRKIEYRGFDAQAFGENVIYNKTPSVAPIGVYSFDGLNSAIGYRIRTLKPSGWYQPKLGNHKLSKTPELKPSGLNQITFGSTWVSNKTRSIYAGLGRESLAIGESKVWHYSRSIRTSGLEFSKYGTASIEHGRRTILAKGSTHTTYSNNSWVSYALRSLLPSSIAYPNIPNHRVGGTQNIQPFGYVATQFGIRIIPESQSIYPQGFINPFGISAIDLWEKYIKPNSFLTTGQEGGHRFGTHKFWNLRQYIEMYYDVDSGLTPPKWIGWTNIENKNKTIGAIGSNSARISEPNIENKARLLHPGGLSASAFGKLMIADGVRHLNLQGMEPPYMGGWSVIYNAAHVIAQNGFKADSFGIGSILNTRRYFNRIGNFESLEFGEPMIADRIRTLKFEHRYTIAPPYIPIHKIHLHTRYIEEVGRFDDYQAFGNPSLSIHWNIVTPRWTNRDYFGDPRLFNVTPELGTQGRNSEEFGQASIRTQWRELLHLGSETVVWGRSEVAFRDRQFSVNGFTQWAIPRHTVIKTGVPPYYPQYIWLDAVEIDGEQNDGHGIGLLKNQVPVPNIKTNVIFPVGFIASRYGSHHTQSNGILVQPGLQELTIGSHFVGLKDRKISVSGINNKIIVSNPRLSPHTIYAVMDAPVQAKQNHSVSNLHYVNSSSGNRKPGEVFGRTTITLRHRKLSVGLGNQSYLNDGHKIQLRKRYINLKDFGFRSQRIGFHVVGPFDQNVMQFDSNDMQNFGRPSLGIPYGGAFFIKPNGISSPTLNRPTVDFFNRSIKAVGSNHLQMGTRKSGDSPYMWQGLRVGELVKGNYGGFKNEVFGNTFVSLKVRNVEAQGFESFVMEYDYTQFDQRMRVIRQKLPKPKLFIEPVGVATLFDTVPNIKPAVHYIRPDGNADQYRKGAF